MSGIPQNVLDALDQADTDRTTSGVADQAEVDAQAALSKAQDARSTADQAATASKTAAIQAVTDWLNNPAVGTA